VVGFFIRMSMFILVAVVTLHRSVTLGEIQCDKILAYEKLSVPSVEKSHASHASSVLIYPCLKFATSESMEPNLSQWHAAGGPKALRATVFTLGN